MDEWDSNFGDGFGSSGFDDGFGSSSSGDGFDNSGFNSSDNSFYDEKGTIVLSWLKITAGVIGGIIGFTINEIIYKNLVDKLWTPLVIALYFLILGLCVFIPVHLSANQCGDVLRFIRKGKKELLIKSCLIGLAALFLLGGLFEIIYEIGFSQKAKKPTSYIIALDVSESMETTDPEKKLSEAMKNIVKNIDDDFPYAVYTFSDEVKCIENMHYKSNQDEKIDWAFYYYGGTALYTAMWQIYDDYKSAVDSGTWIGGDNPKVLVLSDGYPGDRKGNILKSYRKNGLAASTVAVSGADIKVMEYIANTTGGVCISVDDTDKLLVSIEEAITSSYERNLLTYRVNNKHDWIYFIMRVLFLAFLGFIFFFVIFSGNAFEDDTGIIIAVKIFTGLLSAIIFEIVIQNTMVSDGIMRFWYCILASAAILHTLYIKKPSFSGNGSNNSTSFGSGNDQDQIHHTLDDENEKKIIHRLD